MSKPLLRLLGSLILVFALKASASASERFYDASVADLLGEPGSIIRIEAMPGAPMGASAFRVLYRSKDRNGDAIAVSGVIVVPRGNAPRGGRPVVFGDGNQTRDFTFVDNVVEANLRAATHPRAAGEILNVACGERVTILGLASMIAQVLGVTAAPRLEPARDGEVRHSLADIERMEAVLDLRPAVDLRRGLELAAEWYRSAKPGARKRKRKAAGR